MKKISYAIYTIRGKKKTLNYQGLTKSQAKKVISDTNNALKSILLDAEKNRLKTIKGDEYSVIMLNHKTGEEIEVARYKVDISRSGKKLTKI